MCEKITHELFCCSCEENVESVLSTGEVIYPHRKDLRYLPFWMCPHCKCYVGCHHKSRDPLEPLGCIPTKEMRELRKKIHKHLDPMWKGGLIQRQPLYDRLSLVLGREYHTADLRSIEECELILAALVDIADARKKSK